MRTSGAYSWDSFPPVELPSPTLEASSFLTKYRKGADPEGRGGGKDLGEEEGGEMTIRIYCMRKEFIFSKRGKKERK